MFYFDYCASTPISKAAKQAYIDMSTQLIANPSSQHSLGKCALEQINIEKEMIKRLLNTTEHHLTFVKNATEANKKILDRLLASSEPQHVICEPFEPPSIVASLSQYRKKGLRYEVLEVDEEGLICLEDLSRK